MYYQLAEVQRIDELRRELDQFDQAMLTAVAVNDPKSLDLRRKELRDRLRNDPSTPTPRQWTPDEMKAAAHRLAAAVLSGKLRERPPVS